tara:strand:- start:2936 stop:3142 length:207 start_codon:yes stop_codon:yes gene_type:complete
MNHIIDMNGNSVFFGDDFMIKEKLSEGKKELILYAAGEQHVLARKNSTHSFSSSMPGQVLNNFSKDQS